MKPYVDYDEWLFKRLKKDDEDALLYLNACYEDGLPSLFLTALRNVVIARGGIAKMAKKAKLNREHLFRMLSDKGNPEIQSLTKLLDVLGWRIQFTEKEKPKRKHQQKAVKLRKAA